MCPTLIPNATTAYLTFCLKLGGMNKFEKDNISNGERIVGWPYPYSSVLAGNRKQ